MIKVVHRRIDGEDLFCHEFWCEVCNTPIRDIGMAMSVYYGVNLDTLKDGTELRSAIVHKGNCLRSFKHVYNIELDGAVELRQVFRQLKANASLEETR